MGQRRPRGIRLFRSETPVEMTGVSPARPRRKRRDHSIVREDHQGDITMQADNAGYTQSLQ
jgi:hypothetical protein